MQGHEDDSLLAFFPSGFICHDGPYQTYKQRVTDIANSKGCMYRVTGPFDQKPRAVQQDLVVCRNLNSGDSFLIVDEENKKCFSWFGSGASSEEKKYCSSLAPILAPDLTHAEVEEGTEEDDFWNSFDGGKTEYSTMKELGYAPGFHPRLFQISNSSGYMHMKEIFNYQQEDLNNNDVMVLDAYKTVYMWIGRQANKIEKNNSQKKVNAYLQHLQDGRNEADVQIVEVEPCGEPPEFQTHFPEWEDDIAAKWMQDDPYTALQKKMQAERDYEQAQLKNVSAHNDKFLDPANNKFTVDVLRGGIPEGVNPAKKEYYLTDEDFNALFNMTYQAWEGLKDWKRKDLKKKQGLF